MERYDHLQILRAVAASLVVFDHAIVSVELNGQSIGLYGQAAAFCGNVGVDAFFLLSGLIMTIQTYKSFGQPAKALVFAWRRLIRIAPLYWLATLCMFGLDLGLHEGPDHLKRATILSMCFLPNYVSADGYKMFPIVESGWTLNFEILFYALFTLALLFHRRVGLLLLLVVPELIILLGVVYPVQPTHTPTGMLSFYMTNRFLLLSYGVLIGILLCELKRLPSINLPLSPALLLFIPFVALVISPRLLQPAWLWENFIDVIVAIVAMCLMTSNGRSTALNRALIFVGDASYSTYLIHAFGLRLLAPRVRPVQNFLHLTGPPIVPFALFSLVFCTTVGLLVHVTIERPMTLALRRIPVEDFANALFGGRQQTRRARSSQQTA